MSLKGRRRHRRRHQRVLERAQLQPRTRARSRRRSSSRTASTTTTSAPISRAAGTGLAANNVPRKLWLSLRGSRRPVRVPPRRVGQHAAPLVRLLAAGRPERDHEPAARRHREGGGHLHDVRRLADPGHHAHGRLPQRPRRRQGGQAALNSGGDTDKPRVHGQQPRPRTPRSRTPNGTQANRLSFLTTKLKAPLQLSGTPIIDLQASLSTPQSNLAALLVDYGPASHDRPRRQRRRLQHQPGGQELLGDSTAADSACYTEVTKPRAVRHPVARQQGHPGLVQPRLAVHGEQRTPGQKYEFKFPILPTEYTFPAGHQVGVVLLANYSMGIAGTTKSVVTVDTKASKVILPITGGGSPPPRPRASSPTRRSRPRSGSGQHHHHDDGPDRPDRQLPAPDGDRSQGCGAGCHLQQGERDEVRRRHDDGDLHRAPTPTATPRRTPVRSRSPCSTPPRPPATPAAPWAATLGLTLGTPATFGSSRRVSRSPTRPRPRPTSSRRPVTRR